MFISLLFGRQIVSMGKRQNLLLNSSRVVLPNWISGGGRAKVSAPYDRRRGHSLLENHVCESKHTRMPRRSIVYASVILVSLKQNSTTNHSFTRGVSSFHARRALLARRLSAASRPLATGPSKRWTAADHLQRLSSIGRAGRRSATPWHCWPGSRVADHPCRHPCPACLKPRMAANGIITFLESSRGSTALLWRLYATERVPGLYSGELNLNGQTRE